jgi:hypothetical protein
MSVKNGLQMSYSQYMNFVGSIVCIDASTDLALQSDEAPLKNFFTFLRRICVLFLLKIYGGILSRDNMKKLS